MSKRKQREKTQFLEDLLKTYPCANANATDIYSDVCTVCTNKVINVSSMCISALKSDDKGVKHN